MRDEEDMQTGSGKQEAGSGKHNDTYLMNYMTGEGRMMMMRERHGILNIE